MCSSAILRMKRGHRGQVEANMGAASLVLGLQTKLSSVPHPTVSLHTHGYANSPQLLLWSCPSTESNYTEHSKCFSPLSPLTAAGQCVSASVCSMLLSGSVGKETKADPLQLEAEYCSPS